MEAHEVSELQENQEHGSESGLKRVSFSMSVLAVLLAMVTVLGHRTHTEAILAQSRASDQWNFYQAKKIRSVNAKSAADIIASLPGTPTPAAAAATQRQLDYAEKQSKDLDVEQDKAKDLEKEVDVAERKASRFDLGEAMLQIGVIITSITLLTRKQAYWHLGTLFGLAGIIAAGMAFLVR
jgi:hypothetical protein